MKRVLRFLKEQTIVCLLLVFVLILAILRPSFVSANNIKNVLIDVSIYGVAAIAMTISIITGAFDLSLSSNFAWAQIFFCTLLNAWTFRGGVFPAAICTILSCMLIGCINGLVVVKGKIPAFIATMGMNYAVKGWCLVFTDGQMVSTSNAAVTAFGKGTFLGLSYLTYVFIVVAVIASVVMRYTQFGRNQYATGGNIVCAQLCGIHVRFCKFIVFVILGFSAGLAGCMFVCLMRAGSVLYGTDLALTCVAATVVGGTPLSGGKGGVPRTVVGILLLYVIYKGLGFLGLAGYVNTMVKGILLLLVVSFDAFITQSGTKTA